MLSVCVGLRFFACMSYRNNRTKFSTIHFSCNSELGILAINPVLLHNHYLSERYALMFVEYSCCLFFLWSLRFHAYYWFMYKVNLRLSYISSKLSFHFQSVDAAIDSAQREIVDDKRMGNVFLLTTNVAHHIIMFISQKRLKRNGDFTLYRNISCLKGDSAVFK